MDNIDESCNKIKEPELGVSVEEIIYGRYITKLNINEILFLLDIENYNTDLETFQNNFRKSKKGHYKISKSLQDLLKTLNITIYDDFIKFGELSINDNLIRKSSSDNNDFMLYHKSHAEFLHQYEISESVKKYLDEMREIFYKSNELNEKNK